ncbi:hypothetical protein GUJ93_ZPchr0004g40189 [Zizania palustris]|uniref:Uncharacterized protein n=1 Tax=Zizania palustris TaxID=103762 RepID=A0A8J5SLJ4_ZIZPA|nr:hypothetical protein GUJ93_ZPchr0004g40189 [Zizania palustris]
MKKVPSQPASARFAVSISPLRAPRLRHATSSPVAVAVAVAVAAPVAFAAPLVPSSRRRSIPRPSSSPLLRPLSSSPRDGWGDWVPHLSRRSLPAGRASFHRSAASSPTQD